MATVSLLLDEGVARLRESGSETARLDAELLLGHVLGLERTALIANADAQVSEGSLAAYHEALARREAGEPVAYIRGLKEFFGLAFAVDARALIPRPETERLVELAEAEVRHRLVAAPRKAGAAPLRIADVGTGSGAVAIALAVALRKKGMLDEVRITAADVSADAVQLATENAVGHAVGDRIAFEVADLLPGSGGSSWDIVLANLPYVRSAVVPTLPLATSFEPRLALDGGPDGLNLIRRLLAALPYAMARDGVALLEIGGDQGFAIVEAVDGTIPGWRCTVEVDLGGLPRVARVERDR